MGYELQRESLRAKTEKIIQHYPWAIVASGKAQSDSLSVQAWPETSRLPLADASGLTTERYKLDLQRTVATRTADITTRLTTFPRWRVEHRVIRFRGNREQEREAGESERSARAR